MSTPTAATTSSSSPTDTPSSSTDDSDDDLTGGAQYYSYFFLLFAFAFLILFLLLLLYFRRRRKLKNARLQQHGRAALVQDVSLFPPAAGLWSWRAPEEPSRRLDRLRSSACHDSVLEAGLDERGEAPPPYKAASADKAPPVPREAVRQARIGERTECRLPPDYDENGASGEGLDVPARPDAVVTVAERLAEAEAEEQPSQHVHPVHPVHPNRIPPRVGRWGSMRRLMSSAESTV
jgi:hypothetical protein